MLAGAFAEEGTVGRRYTGNMKGERYLANRSHSKREVHDLDAETPRCQIDEIMRANHDVGYESLYGARLAGYDPCSHCIGPDR